MVAGANRDALPVEHLCDVVWMDVADVEGDDPGPALGGRSVEPHALDLAVLLDRFEPGLVDVVHCGAEPNRFGDRLRAGFELRRQLAPGRPLELDRVDHVTTENEG